jgi:hypothetical protein
MPDLSDLLNIGTSSDGSSTLDSIANLVTKLPENIARFVTNPQAFTQLFGSNQMPQQTGFAAGATGLSPQSPYGGGILNPKNEGYEEGYQQGEPVAVASNFLPFVKGKPLGLSMIGPESATWSKEMAFNAGKMEAKGYTPAEIHQNTGMVRGLDNQWRQELSDYYSTMKGDQPFGALAESNSPVNKIGATPEERAIGTTVKDVLDHPALFEAYPDLGDIKVEAHSAESPVKGSYKQSKNTISVREDLPPDEAKSTLLHELTHAVQAKESWNRGANYSQEVQKVQAQKEALMPQIGQLNEKMSEASKAGDNERYRYLMAQRDALADKYLTTKPEEAGYENYRLHGGEAEARLVQERRNLKPDELSQHFPYQQGKYGLDINPDKAIITTEHPASINTPEQSVEAPKSEPNEQGLYSPLENAVLGIKQPKGTGDQILKQLEKTPGVKTEELEHTGLKSFLEGKPSVTKQEVADYIAKNKVELGEHVLGEATGDNPDDYQLHGGEIFHDEDYISSLKHDIHHDLINDPDIYHQEKEALVEQFPELYEGHEHDEHVAQRLNEHVERSLEEQAKQQAHDMYYDNPQYHYYDDYGHEVYGNEDFGYSIKDPHGKWLDLSNGHGLYDISDVEAALAQHNIEQGNLDMYGDGAKYEDYTLPGKYEGYREVLTTLPDKSYELSRELDELMKYKEENPREWTNHLQREVDSIKEKLDANYESGHFDQPNILGHMRLDDRTINGKKVLMVEEIQSDWHQEGRKRGYATPESKELKADIQQKMGYLHKDKMKLRDQYDDARKADDIDAQNEISKKIADIEKQQVDYQGQLNKIGTVPNAPFKKNWHELMMKQALDIAAKGGYDGVAFTTGKQQANRYGLEKHFQSISYNPESSTLYGKQFNGSTINKTIKPEELGDYLGQEVADKLLKTPLESPKEYAGDPVHKLEGLQLSVGGEGMKGFYDKILPSFINKYGKKWGIAVKEAHIPDADETVHYFDMPEQAKQDILKNGQPMFAGIGLAGVPMMGPDDQKKNGILKDIAKEKK